MPVTDPTIGLEDLRLEDVADNGVAQRAQAIINHAQNDIERLPDAMKELLVSIIKPLFSSSHPSITPAGRKPAFAAPPTLPHATRISFDDKKPWQIPTTVPLLRSILKSYPKLPKPRGKEVLEAQFSLLIPPILNIIDDISSSSKADGYALLNLLCDAVIATNSDILRKTGLIDVFMDTVKLNFLLLPTLTPEDESLLVLRQLYPASLKLVQARFDVHLQQTKVSSDKVIPPSNNQAEEDSRQKYLKTILRQGLLASLNHLGFGSSTDSTAVTTFLLLQLRPVLESIGLPAVVHLQLVLPMLRTTLMDPFATSSPHLLLAAIDALSAFITVCKPRIRDKWWQECLRGLVGCWCNVLDSEDNIPPDKSDLKMVKASLRDTVRILSAIVGQTDWSDARLRLLNEAEDLEDLFSPT